MTVPLPPGVAATRVRTLVNPRDASPHSTGRYVLYWMHSAVRASCNHALETAAATASGAAVPLLALFTLDTARPPHWSARHYTFAAEGVRDAREALRARGVALASVLTVDPGTSAAVVAGRLGARWVVTERPAPLREGDAWVDAAARECERGGVGLVVVETNVVVPVEEASGKEEFAARTIRPKIHAKLREYVVDVGEVACKGVDEWPTGPLEGELEWGLTVEELPESVCRRVGEVSRFYKGGYKAAMVWLDAFLQKKLAGYAESRNEPASDFASNLSPYLRYGHISPVEVTLRVKDYRGGSKPGKDSFLEEMIVRRELAFNMCHYNAHYDTLAVIPRYAADTLAEHASDKRPYLYTYEELAAAQTHCPFWNAAQLEMVVTGKMHGYMRMFWCKKILEWVKTPELAFEYAVRLNNVYNLDGSDPNSYAGVAWCFGKHDQGWKERPVFGKVRYMNEAGLRRKFNMDSYVAKINRLAGRSPDVPAKATKAAKARRGGQATLETFLSPKSTKRPRDSAT